MHENARFGAKRSPRECPKCLELSDFEQRTIAEATARKAVVIIGRKKVGHWRREQPAGKLQIPDPRRRQRHQVALVASRYDDLAEDLLHDRALEDGRDSARDRPLV